MHIDVKHDNNNHTFYAEVPGGTAEINYDQFGDKYVEYKSTYVPRDARHEGVGSILAESALDYALKNDLKVKATCPFVKDVMKSNGLYRKLAYQLI